MDIAHPQSLQTDPKIQNVRGYWAGSEDKGISQQTVIQNIFSKFPWKLYFVNSISRSILRKVVPKRANYSRVSFKN